MMETRMILFEQPSNAEVIYSGRDTLEAVYQWERVFNTTQLVKITGGKKKLMYDPKLKLLINPVTI